MVYSGKTSFNIINKLDDFCQNNTMVNDKRKSFITFMPNINILCFQCK